jgi:hypothetical protein
MTLAEVEESRRIGRKCLRCSGPMIAGTIGTLEPLAFFTPATGFLAVGASSLVEAACCEVCGEISLRATTLKRSATENARPNQEEP